MKKIILAFATVVMCLSLKAQSIPVNNNEYHYYGPNSTWGEFLKVGGNGRQTTEASVVTTNGNLHLDSQNGNATYINHYSQGNTYLNTNGGNVGIGTANPSYKFELNVNRNSRTRASIINQSTGNAQETSLMLLSNSTGIDLFSFGSGTSGSISGFPKAQTAAIRTHSGYPADRLVIATGSNAPIHFSTADQPKMTIHQNGRIGIGTILPTYSLELNLNQNSRTRAAIINESTGNAQETSLMVLSNSTGLDLFSFGSNTSGSISGFPKAKTAAIRTHTGSPADRLVIATGSNAPIHFSTADQPKMTIHQNGKVGIGTLNPDTELTVKGQIHAEEVKIDLNIPAPDYVFKEDYNLRSIKDLEKFITENSHLPEIPSAKKFAEDGVMLAEMDMSLLKKIEELTLYIIQQEKKISYQANKIEKLEALNDNLIELQTRIEKLEIKE